MIEIETTTREDVFQGEPGHPQCCFFETFASSADPDETFYGELFCHMKARGAEAEQCKGDYLKCPLLQRQEATGTN